MTERPILFSAPMVRAILEGSKMQTRRLIKRRGRVSLFHDGWTDGYIMDPGNAEWRQKEVVYAVGDHLWVREAFSYSWSVKDDPDRRHLMPIWYWADGNPPDGGWSKPKPSIHMPRWASRITLEVTAVRVQRLQEISEDDATAEGCRHHHDPDGDGQNVIEQFSYLWQSIHGPGWWEANPWVVALTFRRVPQ